MSNVLTIFQEYFDKRGAKRIRFKVDPTLKTGFDIAETYEGYILKETHNVDAILYIPVGDQMGMHNMQGVLQVPEDDRLGPIKSKIVEILKGKPGEEVLPQIMKTNCFMDIESLLCGIGFNSSDIIELLKRVITNEAKFNYVAMDSSGKQISGVVDVADFSEAINRLKGMGYLPISVKPVITRTPKPGGTPKPAGPLPPAGIPTAGSPLGSPRSPLPASGSPIASPTSTSTGDRLVSGAKATGRGLYKGAKALLKSPITLAQKLAKGKQKMDAATRYLKTFEPGYLSRETPKWVPNPNLNAAMFIRDNDFIKWYDEKFDMKNKINNIRTILNNSSVNQLNYLARKYYEFTGKYIS